MDAAGPAWERLHARPESCILLGDPAPFGRTDRWRPHLDDPAHDERLRRLQRIAYGAVASSSERAAALAELDALRREAAAEAADAASDDPPQTDAAAHPATATAS